MVYIMQIYTDGGCRNNGQSTAHGAAAAYHRMRHGHNRGRTTTLPSTSTPKPTNQRAEITGIILGLEVALHRAGELKTNPKLRVTIFSDSKYAAGVMNEWIYRWRENGWVNARRQKVGNLDLIEQASELDEELRGLGGRVKYVWILRGENAVADEWCNEVMDEM